MKVPAGAIRFYDHECGGRLTVRSGQFWCLGQLGSDKEPVLVLALDNGQPVTIAKPRARSWAARSLPDWVAGAGRTGEAEFYSRTLIDNAHRGLSLVECPDCRTDMAA